MDSRALTHPPADDLRAFGVGLLDGTPAEAVARHLETCADCRATASQSEDDSFRRLRESAGQDGAPPTPFVRPRRSPALVGAAVCAVLAGLGALWCVRALRVETRDAGRRTRRPARPPQDSRPYTTAAT